MQCAIVVHPPDELSPASVMDTLGEMMVLDHVAYLEVLIGNQIVRCDQRVRSLAGEILTLPLHFQICFCQVRSLLLAVLALLLLAGYVPMQAFQFLLCLAIVAWGIYRVPFRVGVERFQADIDADMRTCGDMFYGSLYLNRELAIVAVCSLHDADPLDLLLWKGFNLLLLVAYQAKSSDATPIGEGDVSPIWLKLPARGFVFDAPVIVLKVE